MAVSNEIILLESRTERRAGLSLGMMSALRTSSGEKVNVIKQLASHWRDFGLLLEFDDNGATLDTIEKKRSYDPDACCQEMMGLWLQGRGRRQPPTRELLVELLQDCDMKSLAEKVDNWQ